MTVASSTEIPYTRQSLNVLVKLQMGIALANEADQIIWEIVHTLPLYQRPELIATRRELANYGAFGMSSIQWENVGFTE